MDNLVPILTEGLLEVCKRTPDDPVDYLAEYLFRRSLDVPYPDPTSYWNTHLLTAWDLDYVYFINNQVLFIHKTHIL